MPAESRYREQLRLDPREVLQARQEVLLLELKAVEDALKAYDAVVQGPTLIRTGLRLEGNRTRDAIIKLLAHAKKKGYERLTVGQIESELAGVELTKARGVAVDPSNLFRIITKVLSQPDNVEHTFDLVREDPDHVKRTDTVLLKEGWFQKKAG